MIKTGDYLTSEWTGATFDTSGKFMFVNIQDPGVTFVIEGRWDKDFYKYTFIKSLQLY